MSLANIKRGDIVTLKAGVYVHYDYDYELDDDETRPNTPDDRFIVDNVGDEDLEVFPYWFAAQNQGNSYSAYIDWYGDADPRPFVQKIKRGQILEILENARKAEPCIGDYVLGSYGREGVIDNVILENGEASFDVHWMDPYDNALGSGIEHSNEAYRREMILAIDSSLRDSYTRCDCDDRKWWDKELERRARGEKPRDRFEDNRGLGIVIGLIAIPVLVVGAALLIGLAIAKPVFGVALALLIGVTLLWMRRRS